MISVSNTAVTVGGTGATGHATAPGRATSVVLSAVTSDALVTFDGTFPGATTGAHRIYTTGQPVQFPVGLGATIGVVSAAAATGCTVCVSWLSNVA